MFSRSARFQRLVASALAAALCCFVTLTHAEDSQAFGDTQQFSRAASSSDQCLLACNGSNPVVPVAPIAKTRLTAVPRAILAVLAAPVSAHDVWLHATRSLIVRGPRMVGTIELRL